MAIAHNHLSNDVGATSSGTSRTTDSHSPQDNALQLMGIANYLSTGNPAAPSSVTGGGMTTWTQVATQQDGHFLGTKYLRVSVYRALEATPGTGQATITFAASQTNIGYVWDEFTGVDTSGSNGAGAIVQSASSENTSGSTTSFTQTLAAFGSSNNWGYGCIMISNGNGQPSNVTAGNSYSNAHMPTDEIFPCSIVRLGDADPNLTWTTGNTVGGIGIEIKAAASATSLPPVSHHKAPVRQLLARGY